MCKRHLRISSLTRKEISYWRVEIRIVDVYESVSVWKRKVDGGSNDLKLRVLTLWFLFDE